MPTVPRIQRQVSPTALPAARLTASLTEGAAGVGVAEANANAALQEGRASQQKWGALAGLGDQVARVGPVLANIVLQERQRADEVALMDAENQLAMRSNPLLTDALGRKGKDALGVPEATLGEFNKAATEIEASLTTARQKAAFARVRGNRAAQMDLTLRRHVLGEMDKYEATELKAKVENSVSSAVANANDPARAQFEIANAVESIKTSGPRLGLGPEAVQAEVLKVQTSAHVGIIEQLVAQDRMTAAKTYFEEAREAGQISGEAQARVVKALEEGTARKQAQEAFDTITDTLPEDQWTKAARELKDDPKLRDEVERRIEHQKNINERARREAHEAIGVNAKNIIDKGGYGDITKIPGWTDLTPGEAGQLRAYAEHKVTQVAVKTDPGTYHYLVDLATSDDPKKHEAFVKLNMMGLVGKLSSSDWQQFVDAQGRTRKGDHEAVQKLLVNPTVQNKMVDEALLGMGMDPTPKQPGVKGADDFEIERVNQFRRAVREEVQAVEARTGKPATDIEVQKIVDVLRTPTGQKVKDPGFFWDTKVPSFAFDVPDVPPNDRQQITDALKARGIPVTETQIQRLYGEQLRRAAGKK